MWLKVVIVLLFLALLASLTGGFWFLIKDQGTTRRTWYALSVRLVLAVVLIGLLIYGLRTGQLGSHAPWDAYRADPEQQAP